MPSASTAANGLVYVATNASGSSKNYLYALSASTGTVSSSLYLNLNGITSAPIVANGDVYFVGSADNYLYAYSANFATRQWSFRNGQNGARGTPVADNGEIFVVSDSWPAQLLLYALNATSGAQLWHSTTTVQVDPDAANRVVFASSGSALYAFGEGTGLYMWIWVPPSSLIQSARVGTPFIGR
jgi:outer membrane protein assembly factor BamB